MQRGMNDGTQRGLMSTARRRNLVRFIIGPLAILCVFLFLEKNREFHEVWKPLALYYAMALPGFLLVDRLRARASRAGVNVNVGDAQRKEGAAS